MYEEEVELNLEKNSSNFLYGFSIRFFLGDVFFLGKKLLNI